MAEVSIQPEDEWYFTARCFACGSQFECEFTLQPSDLQLSSTSRQMCYVAHCKNCDNLTTASFEGDECFVYKPIELENDEEEV